MSGERMGAETAAVRVENARLREILVEMLAVSRDALSALQDVDQDVFDGGVLTGRLRDAIAAAERWREEAR